MDKSKTELLFPAHILVYLTDTRGEDWQLLVTEIASLRPDSLEIMAFTLLMVRIGNCIFCNSDSYRAIHGCRQCARQALTRFRGSDGDLINMYKSAKIEVEEFMEKKKNYG